MGEHTGAGELSVLADLGGAPHICPGSKAPPQRRAEQRNQEGRGGEGKEKGKGREGKREGKEKGKERTADACKLVLRAHTKAFLKRSSLCHTAVYLRLYV